MEKRILEKAVFIETEAYKIARKTDSQEIKRIAMKIAGKAQRIEKEIEKKWQEIL